MVGAAVSALRVSRPGRPTVLVRDIDPWAGLTPWQRTVAEAVLARNGHQTHAAADLGASVSAVHLTVRRIAAAGVRLPASPRRGPDLRDRKGKAIPCGLPLARTGTPCGRGRGHAGGHRSLAATERVRAWQRWYDADRRAR